MRGILAQSFSSAARATSSFLTGHINSQHGFTTQSFQSAFKAHFNQSSFKALRNKISMLLKSPASHSAAVKSLYQPGVTLGGLFMSSAAAAAVGVSPHNEAPEGAAVHARFPAGGFDERRLHPSLARDPLWLWAAASDRPPNAEQDGGRVSSGHAKGAGAAHAGVAAKLSEADALLAFASAGSK